MVLFSLFTRCVQLVRQRQAAFRGISAASLVAIAGIVEIGSVPAAWGQTGYPVPMQAADPGQVFSSGPDVPSSANWSSSALRRSPYFDYRCNPPAGGQFNPMPGPGLNGPLNAPAWGNGSNGSLGQGTSRTASPYFSGRYGTPPPGLAGTDSQFPTPYAGSLYGAAPPSQQNSVGNFDPNGGGPGGWSSPAPIPVPVSDPNGTCASDPNTACNRGDCALYMPYGSMGYFGGTTPSTAYNDLFVPLMQTHTEILYADVRGLFNTQSAYQGSFGGGLRTLLSDSIILGGYGFYDFFQSSQHNQFQQATVGVELLTYRWEARSNGYIPTSQGSNGSGGTAGTAFLQNGGIFLGGTQQRGLSGIDAEFGMLVAADPTARRELRAFAGGYDFTGSNGSQDIPGVYGRLEARLYDLNFLGQGSRLEMGVISSYDDVNRFQVTGMLICRIAFGTTNCPGCMSLIERRMLDRVVRRQEVVTSQSTSADPGTVTIGGNPLNSVLLVTPTTPNLQAKIDAAPAHSLIVVEGGSGTQIVPNGITLNPGQALVGGGTKWKVEGSTGQTGTLTLPGSTPTIDRPNSNGPVITMASNTSVVGVNLQGGMPAIYSNSGNHLFVSNVNVSQCLCDGMQFLSVNGLTISNVTLSQTSGITGLGILLQNVSNAEISNVSISQTIGSAFFFAGGTNAQINGLTIDGAGANDDALKILSLTNSVFTNVQIHNTTSNNNAVTVTSSTGLVFNQIQLTNITGDGFLSNQSSSIALSNLTLNNVATGGSASGTVFDNSSIVSLNHSIFTNVGNDISFLNTLSQISGTGNTSTGQTTLSTGTTGGGGSIHFTSPNATVQ